MAVSEALNLRDAVGLSHLSTGPFRRGDAAVADFVSGTRLKEAAGRRMFVVGILALVNKV
jgi:hypothetical protein